jgi:hypothetical protein
LVNAHTMKPDSVEEVFPNGICRRRLVARVCTALTERCPWRKEESAESPASEAGRELSRPKQLLQAIADGLPVLFGVGKPWLQSDSNMEDWKINANSGIDIDCRRGTINLVW